MTVLRIPAALAFTLVAGSAMAHTGHGGGSFTSGLVHPFSGLDHLLAMLAVGLYAARQAGVARWLLPAGFVAAMLGGAALDASGVALPLVETGIAASVLVFGLLLAFVIRLRLAAAMALVAVFALFHGHAHHAEMAGASAMLYSAGFSAATMALHATGYALARAMPQAAWSDRFTRLLGGLFAGAGLVLLGS